MLNQARQRGVTLFEVLITILIMGLGLLGLAGLESRMMMVNSEAYQRSQAVALLSDMAERLRVNQNNLNGTIDSGYIHGGTAWGTGNSGYTTTDCSTQAAGEARDVCEWNNALLGAAETSGTSQVGAMIGARGCITQVQAADTTTNVCKPGIYGVTVSWQGLSPTATPSTTGWSACGATQYGSNDALRRSISAQVVVPLNQC
jgi:type IV pilus assembly protein PilV